MQKYMTVNLTDEQCDALNVPHGFAIVLEESLMERFVQEEVYAQTWWPDGEPMLFDVLADAGLVKRKED